MFIPHEIPGNTIYDAFEIDIEFFKLKIFNLIFGMIAWFLFSAYIIYML